MRFCTLFTGGKDSVFSLYHYLNQAWEPRYLVSILSENRESYMYHTPNIALTALSAKALGIPLIQQKTKGEKERELDDLKKALQRIKTKIDAVVSGAIFSDYQKTRIEEVCHNLGLKSFSPLWHRDQLSVLSEIVSAGFEVIITAVAAQGLGESWLGRKIDEKALSDLKKIPGINPAGEGGEFETFVIDGPIFKKPIRIEKAEKVWEKNSGYLDIKKARI